MEVFIGIMIFNMLLLGLNFCFLLIGGLPWHKGPEFEPIKISRRNYTVEYFSVGVTVSILGVSWLIAWFYFMISSEQPLALLLDKHFLHIFLQLVAGIMMTTAGVAIFRQWKRSKGIYLSSIFTFFATSIFAILYYGVTPSNTNVMLMYSIAMWTLVYGGFFSLLTFTLGRMIHKYDEKLPEKEKPTLLGTVYYP